jgi:hypothetical protein
MHARMAFLHARSLINITMLKCQLFALSVEERTPSVNESAGEPKEK